MAIACADARHTNDTNQTTLFFVSKSRLIASSARHSLVTEKKRTPHLGPPHLKVPKKCSTIILVVGRVRALCLDFQRQDQGLVFEVSLLSLSGHHTSNTQITQFEAPQLGNLGSQACQTLKFKSQGGMSHVCSGSRCDPHPQRGTIFHLVLGGKRKSGVAPANQTKERAKTKSS